MFSKQVQSLLAAILIMLGLLAAYPNQAQAHATIQNTAPNDGATLEQAPRQVRIWFDQPVVDRLSRIELIDLNGKHWEVSNLRAELDTTQTNRSTDSVQTVLIADLPSLPISAYRIVWQTRSADDLHVINGNLIFGIQQSVAGLSNQEVTYPSWLETGLRWLVFLGFNTLLGTMLLRGLLFRGVSSTPISSRLNKLILLAAGLALAGWAGLLVFQGAYDGSWLDIVTRTNYGARLVVAALLLLVIIIGGLLSGRWRNRVQELSGVGLLAVQALDSHYPLFTPFNFGVDVLHLLGASFWAGGLLALALIIVPILKTSPEDSHLILMRFGKFAGLSLLILIITGLYKSGQQVASLDGLLTSTYGQALLAKFDLVIYAAILALLNTSILHPAIAGRIGKLLRKPAGWQLVPARYTRRLILIEAGSLALILLLAAFLTASPPARGPQYEPPVADNAAVPTVSSPSDDLILTLSVKPNRPGENFINLAVYNTRRPAPAPIEKVQVRLQPPDNQGTTLLQEAQSLGGGRYQIAGNSIKSAGEWQITLLVTRPGLSDINLKVPWRVLSPNGGQTRPVVFSNSPLAPWLNLAALLLVVGSLIMLGWWAFKSLTLKSFLNRGFVAQAPQSQEE